MIERKKKIYFADALFLVAMTFVLAFPNPSVYKALSIVAFFCFMALQSMMKNRKIGENLQYIWAIAFYGICDIGRMWSVYPGATEEVITNVMWSLMVSISTVNYIRVYKLSVIDMAKRMFIVGIIFVINIIFNGVYVDGRYTVNIGGYILNENVFGQIASGIAGLMIFWSKKNNWKGFFVNFFAVIMIIFALLSGSRKYLVAAAIYFIVFVMYEYPPKGAVKKIARLFWIVITIIIAYLCVTRIEALYNSIGSRVESLFVFFGGDDKADGSAFTRMNMLKTALELFKNKPLLGYGTNTFSRVSGFRTYAHNNYVELLANLGVVGMLIYYIPIMSYFFRAVRLWKNRVSESIFALCYIGIFLLNDFASVSYFAMPTHLFLALGIGVLVNLIEQQKEENSDNVYIGG